MDEISLAFVIFFASSTAMRGFCGAATVRSSTGPALCDCPTGVTVLAGGWFACLYVL